ncbi:hypothetical protein GE061_019442 [Apolygus lucorum]|uniref:Single domain-containing protein n=1 Tax=Apolygus lucorum TaxID=248454 RepID=A0A6A4J6W5_APOLU|nr:hypothetical protein GE061_019442 [Apolygus lucorum]
MHTWLILASLFGVAFTKAVKPAKDTDGVCNTHGIKVRVGEEAQPPGKCYLVACEEKYDRQGVRHLIDSPLVCEPEFVEVGKDFVPPKRTNRTNLPYPDCCDVEYVFPEDYKGPASKEFVSSSSGE